MSVIFLIIFILLFALIIIVSFVLSLLRGLFSLFSSSKQQPHNKTSQKRTASNGSGSTMGWDTRGASNNENGKKVLFEKDEGEYVDFEEIKD